jgi:hypothetical protein
MTSAGSETIGNQKSAIGNFIEIPMKPNRSKKPKTPKRLQHNFPLLIVVGVIAVVALAAMTVISRQKYEARVSSAPVETAAVSKQQPTFVTVNIAGRDVQVDPRTGHIKALTSQEAQQLAEGLKGMFNKSTEGLVTVRESDGSLSMDLEGRFQNVTVARTNEDGSVSQSCVDNPEAAANFFRIDPQLVGVQSPSTRPGKPSLKSPIQ